jgi:hypothetical protein
VSTVAVLMSVPAASGAFHTRFLDRKCQKNTLQKVRHCLSSQGSLEIRIFFAGA